MRTLIPVFLALIIFTSTQEASAGSRELEVLFVNMTPDAESGGTSKKCVESIRSRIKKRDTRVKKLGESKIRKAVGINKEDAPFITWAAKLFKKQIYPKGDADVVILVDCRPDKKHLELLLVPTRLRPLRISYQMEPTEALLKAVTDRLLAHAWDDFSP